MEAACLGTLTGLWTSKGVDSDSLTLYIASAAHAFVRDLCDAYVDADGVWKGVDASSDLFVRLDLPEPNMFSATGAEALCVDVSPRVLPTWREIVGRAMHIELDKFSAQLRGADLPNLLVKCKNGAVLVTPWYS